MRKAVYGIDEIKRKVAELKGRRVMMRINKGRKRITGFNATVAEAYSAVFVVRPEGGETVQSYSYSDILCGTVKLKVI